MSRARRDGGLRRSVMRVVVALALLAVWGALPGVALGAEVAVTTTDAQAALGGPTTFSTSFRTGVAPRRVELLTRLPRDAGVFVEEAEVEEAGDGYRARVVREGHVVPNTILVYRFRFVFPDGAVLGPEQRLTVRDERFQWRTRERGLVRLHWYEGGDDFADRALEIADKGMRDATGLLGVTESEPIDFFIYAGEQEFREALGPGTRENVGGQANASIRTLFALIRPTEVGSSWVGVVVPHELTHLVFDTAVRNPYHFPPRWLNEGIAVYLSEGLSAANRTRVSTAARDGELIPLDGLAGLFPTTAEKFFLAYAESVSAVDFFVRTYGEPKLVSLVRSYAQGLTDDDAFRAATGEGVNEFNAAWFREVGGTVPEPVGPRPGQPGPTPADWGDGPGASASPGRNGSASPAATPAATPGPAAPGQAAGGGWALPLAAAAAVLVLAATVLVVRRRSLRARSQPRPTRWPPSDG